VALEKNLDELDIFDAINESLSLCLKTWKVLEGPAPGEDTFIYR
jgi:hypothetical protein